MNDLYTIAIVDDNAALRNQLTENLQDAAHIQVVFTATNGQDAIDKLLQQTIMPAVVLMDIEMPVMNGIESTAIITQNSAVKVLILTVFDNDDKVFDAIKAGASGYLLKDSKPHQIVTAIEDVMMGGAPMSPHIAAKALQLLRGAAQKTDATHSPADYNLTDRETEVLKLLAQGLSYQQIANNLFISHGTVRKHVENIYGKLHINSKAQAVSFVHQKKWV